MAAWDNQTSAGLAPRLRIAHLLCWTVASAFGFAAYRGITPSLAPGVYIGIGVYDSVMGLALGTILTGVSIMAYRRWRDGMPYPSLPGHWLLVFGLAAAVADSVAIGVFQFLTRLYYPPSKWHRVRSTCRAEKTTLACQEVTSTNRKHGLAAGKCGAGRRYLNGGWQAR